MGDVVPFAARERGGDRGIFFGEVVAFEPRPPRKMLSAADLRVRPDFSEVVNPPVIVALRWEAPHGRHRGGDLIRVTTQDGDIVLPHDDYVRWQPFRAAALAQLGVVYGHSSDNYYWRWQRREWAQNLEQRMG